MIPKIIHYCWFGPKEIPASEQEYIKDWHEKLPEFEIKIWNEQSFDLNIAATYVQQAYEAKKYAFVSDYVRMYVLQKYGGIYFDTDVEVLSDLTPFLDNKFFMGFENRTMLGTAVIGSEPGVWIMNEMIEHYNNHNFLDANGLPDTTTNVQILAGIMEKHGMEKENKEQIIDGLHLYERDFFFPKKIDDKTFRISERTVTIHHMDGSWLTERERKRGSNKFWINVCRPILRKVRNVIITSLGEDIAKKLEVKLRSKMR